MNDATDAKPFSAAFRSASASAGAEVSTPTTAPAPPAAARLRSYLHGGAFRDPPEGSVLPESDASSYDRA